MTYKKCKTEDCENECQENTDPKEVLIFRIPFTSLEVRVWDWSGKGYHEYCTECMEDYENHKNDDTYNAISQDAYQRGFEDAQRAPWEF